MSEKIKTIRKRSDATKLTSEDLIKIKLLYNQDKVASKEICRQFRIGFQRLVRILNGNVDEVGGGTNRKAGAGCVSGGGLDEEIANLETLAKNWKPREVFIS